ncbi:MAG: GGDEF domain-containing protein [Roseiarcus sp.]
MINLVNSVADLTALRDREELEIAVALVAADLSGASAGRLWRLTRHLGELRLHERARLTDRSVVISELPVDLGDLPTLDSREELRACYDSRTTAPVSLVRDGRRRHVFPMMGAGEVAGFLEICDAAPLRDDQRQLVSAFLRIYHNHLNVLDYGESDELTGLLNRKTFDAAFAHLTRIEAPSRPCAVPFVRVERRRPTGPDQPRWLAALDIDFFKRVNDRFGHACGDEVLVQMARLMRASFRESDRLFRCGGEEFVAILEPTEGQYVEGILERFRAAVEAYPFPQVGCVTVSIGYTRVAPRDDGLAAFRRADEALYAAKRLGRNRVVRHEDLPGAALAPTQAGAAAPERALPRGPTLSA